MEINTYKQIINITELESNYIERLFYEYNASLNILRFLMSQNDINQEYLIQYQKTSEEKYTILEIGKKEISTIYKPKEAINYNYTFDFNNNSIIYTWEKTNE